MASAKKNGNGDSTENVNETVGSGAKVGKFDLKDLLPAGHDEKDVIVTGQLLPQFLGKEHLERAKAKGLKQEDIPIVVGFLDRVEPLPLQERKNQKDFAPFSMVIRELKVPSVGYRGPKDKREEVAVAEKGSILFPISGQQSVNRDLLKALRDPEYLYWFIGEVLGERTVDASLNDMVDYRIRIVRTKEKRIDRGAAWALDPWYMACLSSGALHESIASGEHRGLLKTVLNDGLEVTATGLLVNRSTGEPIGILDANTGRVMPPPKEIETSAAVS